MTKIILFAFIGFSFLLGLACSPAATTSNSAPNKAVVVNANSTNLPEGLSANQITLSNDSTPGIPDPKSINANGSKGAASTLGIPNTANAGNKANPAKTPPIAGIPDEETLRKEMNTPADRSIMDRKSPQTTTADHPNGKQRPAHNSKPNM